MDQIKVGKFIQDQRKKIGITQMQLAEKLNITDRAVSKWERGKGMPDSSIMLELCDILKISVNELLSGEVIDMKDYNEKTKKLLIEMTQKEEEQNKKLMTAMWTILISNLILYLGIAMLSVMLLEEGLLQNIIIISSTAVFIVAAFISIMFEAKAGYYECANCHAKHVPSYTKVVFALHIGTTRYLKCPSCNKTTWSKKVMTKG